jgi:hypothetical protein
MEMVVRASSSFPHEAEGSAASFCTSKGEMWSEGRVDRNGPISWRTACKHTAEEEEAVHEH